MSVNVAAASIWFCCVAAVANRESNAAEIITDRTADSTDAARAKINQAPLFCSGALLRLLTTHMQKSAPSESEAWK